MVWLVVVVSWKSSSVFPDGPSGSHLSTSRYSFRDPVQTVSGSPVDSVIRIEYILNDNEIRPFRPWEDLTITLPVQDP